MKKRIGIPVACAAVATAVTMMAGGSSLAQVVTVKCWKEGCITVGGQTSCIREEIPCPPPQVT